MTGAAPKGMTPIRTWIAHGFRCALVRAPIYGAINGYVQVPGITPEQVAQVEVHYGVTYEGDDGWIGFDTLHLGDWWPAMASYGSGRRPHDRTWTEDEVAAETERMAASAKAVIEQ